jgi:membrane protease YdiL (CAAX protease family)
MLFAVLALVIAPMFVREVVTRLQLFERGGIVESIEQTRLLAMADRGLWVLGMMTWLAMRPSWSWRAFLQNLRVNVHAGLGAFLVLTPIVLAVNLAAGVIHIALGGIVETHPLAKLTTGSTRELAIVAVSAGVIAPLFEELFFRGLLLNWCRERLARAWIVFGIAAYELLSQRGLSFLPAPLFLLDLLLLMTASTYLKQTWKRWPTRSACGLAAVAALFAVVHAAVWPTPWPLLLLAVGLGGVTLRSGSLVPAVVAHSLFNCVTVVYLVRHIH